MAWLWRDREEPGGVVLFISAATCTIICHGSLLLPLQYCSGEEDSSECKCRTFTAGLMDRALYTGVPSTKIPGGLYFKKMVSNSFCV